MENWRNFTRVDVQLERRVFLVGPNASGKSNFLDAFRLLRDIVSVGGGFQAAVKLRGGVSRLRSLSARRYPDIALSVHVGTGTETETWGYELRFTQNNQRVPILTKEVVTRQGKTILNRPDPDDRRDPERLTQTFLEQVNANSKFREVANFFASIRYQHLVPQLVREPDRSTGKVDDPYGGDFLEQIAKVPDRTRQARLRRIRDALKVAVPQLGELEFWRGERGTPHLRGKYEHWRPTGAWQMEDQFSDGTLRLLGLLWATLDRAGPLLLEEPELSLHPAVVVFIPQLFARVQGRLGRQILMSTHSTDLLSDTGIGLDEVLLLQPRTGGTEVAPASTLRDARVLLEEGLPLSDAVMPHTRPEKADQLALFGEGI
jgi:predicted ATPase